MVVVCGIISEITDNVIIIVVIIISIIITAIRGKSAINVVIMVVIIRADVVEKVIKVITAAVTAVARLAVVMKQLRDMRVCLHRAGSGYGGSFRMAVSIPVGMPVSMRLVIALTGVLFFERQAQLRRRVRLLFVET